MGQPLMPKSSSSGSSNPRQGSAGTISDTEKRDGPQCCQLCPLERLDLPKTCCPLAQGAKQSLAQEVSWIMPRERLLKPLILSWAFPAGSYWMLAVFSLFRAGFGAVPAGFRTSPVAEGSSLSFPQADTLGMSPCHTCGKGAAGLCWGSGCGGAAPAMQLPMDPSPKGAVPCQQHSQGGAHQYLLSPEALGSLEVNIVGAVTPLMHSQGCGHVCHQHRRVLGWESSSGLGFQFHPEPPAVPQVLGVSGDQGEYILLLQLLRNDLDITPGMVCRGENPKIPNDFSWGSLGVQSHSPVPVPGAGRTSLGAGWQPCAVSQPGLLSGLDIKKNAFMERLVKHSTGSQSSDGVPVHGGVGKVWLWHLGTRIRTCGGAGCMVGPRGLRGFSHNDSMILCWTGSAQSRWWPCPDLSGCSELQLGTARSCWCWW